MAALVTDSGRRTPARLAGSAILACQSDERLISMVREGHERAFDAIVDRYRRPLLRRCRRILPESRAEDAVQQTFLNAHTSLSESDEAINLKPWLYAIARNVSLNMLRQNGWNYDQIPAEFDGVRRPDQIVEQRAQIEQTVSAMNELPERQRSALVMREFEGRSYAEIAAVLGTGDGAVRQLLNRARAAVRTAASAVMPPPLVARLVTSPPDGRGFAEVVGGLGAAGMAKAGATALIAGSLVVGAVNAPLPLGAKDKPVRERATLAHRSAPATAAAAAAPLTTSPIARSVHGSPSGSAAPHHSGTTGSAPSSGHGVSERSGSTHGSAPERHSGSGDDRSSGSDDTRHSGSDDSPSSESGDESPTRSRSGTSGGDPDDSSPNSGSGSSDDTPSSSGSDDVVASAEPDHSGSGSSGSGTSGSGRSGSDSSGSGSSEPTSDSSGHGSDDPAPVLPTDD